MMLQTPASSINSIQRPSPDRTQTSRERLVGNNVHDAVSYLKRHHIE